MTNWSTDPVIEEIGNAWDEAVCSRLPLEANCLSFDIDRCTDGSVGWRIRVDGCYVNGRELPPMWCGIWLADPSSWNTAAGRSSAMAKIEDQATWFARFYR